MIVTGVITLHGRVPPVGSALVLISLSIRPLADVALALHDSATYLGMVLGVGGIMGCFSPVSEQEQRSPLSVRP